MTSILLTLSCDNQMAAENIISSTKFITAFLTVVSPNAMHVIFDNREHAFYHNGSSIELYEYVRQEITGLVPVQVRYR